MAQSALGNLRRNQVLHLLGHLFTLAKETKDHLRLVLKKSNGVRVPSQARFRPLATDFCLPYQADLQVRQDLPCEADSRSLSNPTCIARQDTS